MQYGCALPFEIARVVAEQHQQRRAFGQHIHHHLDRRYTAALGDCGQAVLWPRLVAQARVHRIDVWKVCDHLHGIAVARQDRLLGQHALAKRGIKQCGLAFSQWQPMNFPIGGKLPHGIDGALQRHQDGCGPGTHLWAQRNTFGM